MWSELMRRRLRRNDSRRAGATPRSFTPRLEALDERIVPSATAKFSAPLGVLTIQGDAADDNIVVSRNGDIILVNGNAVAGRGGPATVLNTTVISVFGGAGNDTITLDETNGALPRADMFGGTGDDTLTGGSGDDQLNGQAGDDTLLGKRGNDLLFGGAGDDVLTAGPGSDQVFGGAGDDRMIWNPGDGSAVNEGGAGTDTVVVNGGNAAEQFTITANGSRVRFDRTNPAPFSLDIGTSENLVLNANGGDDTVDASGLTAGLIQLAVDGGAGNDTIVGSQGADSLLGGDGNDLITGGKGNDALIGGAGDDTFVWNPGDGSDTIEGQDGHDAMLFNGANVDETVDISANGSRVRFFRNPGNITMDMSGVEEIDFSANGGADAVTVQDLSGTDVTAVNINLASNAGVSQSATVVVNGTAADDNLSVTGDTSDVAVVGLSAEVHVAGAQADNGRLTVSTLAGDDAVDASGLAAGAVQLTVDGGDGDDALTGSQGNDTLLGGTGDDVLIGGGGVDVLDGGPGDNIVRP
jgi:Ca2+-binding RTX toxin-like protein